MTFAAQTDLTVSPQTAGTTLAAPIAAVSRQARPIVLAPSENVLVTVVDLPLAGLRQRAAALPFAVEDRIAEPLGNVHIVLGAEIAPRRHLAAIIRHAVMRDLVAQAATNCRIIPDALAVPVPIDTGWAALRDGDRVLVRAADGSGFAVEADMMPALWNAAGRPSILSYGEALPDGIASIASTLSDEAAEASLLAARLDLRQGAYAPRTSVFPAIAKWALGLAAVALLAHTLVALADLWALNGIVSDRERDARQALARVAPGLPDDADVVALFNRLQPPGAATGGRFLPLMAATAAALQPFAGAIDIQKLAFADSDRSLAMTIEASDLATLQAIEQALAAADLGPQSGPATTERGAAQVQITVRGSGTVP